MENPPVESLILFFTLLVLIAQAIIFGRQAVFIRKTFEKMGEIEERAVTSDDKIRKHEEATRDFSQQELRAYVVCQMASVFNIVNPIIEPGVDFKASGAEVKYPNGTIFVPIQIVNAGKTPAFDVKHYTRTEFREYPLLAPLTPIDVTDENVSVSIMGPGIINTKNVFHALLTPDQTESLRNASSAFYVYGLAIYLDAFKKERRTRYTMMYHAYGGILGINNGLSMYRDGNEAT